MGRVHPIRRAGGLLLGAALAGCAGFNGFGGGGEAKLDKATPIEQEFILAAVTWDLNKDGDVTCDEWKQYATSLFREADANRDGILTREEFAAMARVDRLFDVAGLNYFDANADGRVSLAELIDKPNPAFTYLDKDGDCIITPDERRGIGNAPGKGSGKGSGKKRS